MSPRAALVAQFSRPHGLLGSLAGAIMARRPSNRSRNLWTVDLLDLRPADRVLEIGCGPGLALAAAAAKVQHGLVVGLDHSRVMLDQAARRNRQAVADGRIELVEGGIATVGRFTEPFDRIFSVNVIPFVADRPKALAALAAILRPGGLLATTYMPRHPGAVAADAAAMAGDLGRELEAAGFETIRIDTLPLEPVPAVCVTGVRPGAGH